MLVPLDVTGNELVRTVTSLRTKLANPAAQVTEFADLYARLLVPVRPYIRHSNLVIIPHGIYDLARNQGWIHVGLSRDTTEFACDSLRLFWHADGQRLYPKASAILLLCDGGGSNSCHKHLFKEDLQGVVNDLAVPIRVAHYPAYCSKFNPIERRLFSHVTRACQGVLFDSLHTVLGLMQKTKTQQGLTVTVRVLDKLYQGGRTVSEVFKKNMPIVFEKLLPKWNYWALPQ